MPGNPAAPDTAPTDTDTTDTAGPSDAAGLGVLLLRAVSELLATLGPRDLAELAAGRARLAVVPAEPPAAIRPATTPPAATPVDVAPVAAASATAAAVGVATVGVQAAGGTAPARQAGQAGRAVRAPRRSAGPAARAAGGSRRGRVSLPTGAALKELARSLRDAPSREAAEQLLGGLGPLTVAALRELAAGLGVEGVSSRDTRAVVLGRIVEGTVGRRLRSEAMSAGRP